MWHPGFDPSKESISTLDLWVLLYFLPEEYANAEALAVILESNFAGSFIKMDPAHNNSRMNMFTRFCINTDVAINVGKEIIILDENYNQIKYKLWFNDFPDGCGACGLPDHLFDDCSNRAIPFPTLEITIKKAKHNASSSSSEEWFSVGKHSKAIASSNGPLIHPNKPYLAEKAGVNIIYESEESDEPKNKDPTFEMDYNEPPPPTIPVSDGIFFASCGVPCTKEPLYQTGELN